MSKKKHKPPKPPRPEERIADALEQILLLLKEQRGYMRPIVRYYERMVHHNRR